MRWIILPDPTIYGLKLENARYCPREKDVVAETKALASTGQFTSIHAYKLVSISNVKNNPEISKFIVNEQNEVVPDNA